MGVKEAGKSIREKFREFLHGEYREKKLNYRLASSSGKAISEEVPALIGKRAGWASKQGASFIELAIENPSMILSDMEELKNTARQLEMSYSAHSSTNIGMGTSYLHAGGRGHAPAQDYHRKLFITCGKLKEAIEETTQGEQTFTHINAHASINTAPPEEERLARDVSVGPFGNEMRNSDIFNSAEARVHIWEGFVKPLTEQEERLFQQIISELGLDIEFIDRRRELVLNELINRGYLPRNPQDDLRIGRSYDEMEESEIRRYASRTQEGIEEGEIISRTQKAERDYPEYPAVGRKEYRDMKDDAEEDAKEHTYELVREALKDSKEDMEVIANIRSITEEFNKESSVFRKILPRWMPHADEKPVRDMWEKITGKSSGIPPDSSEGEIKDLKDEIRGEEKLIAASTASLIWGQLTQISREAPGVEDLKGNVSLVEILDYYDIQLAFEAHMASTAESIRIWVPADRMALSEAVNSTEVGGDTYDVIRVTIDMEHLATQKIDPIWVIEGDKSRDLKGLKKGEGKLIRMMHVTHPYITESGPGHQHGPIRRGDTLVFDYIYRLIEKGFASREDEPAIIMYEYGPEQAENIFNLRLILDMIENGIEPEDLKVENIENIMDKEPETLKGRLLQEFFGLSDQEMRHEWQSIHEHALDPLEGMLQFPKGTHTWGGRAATQAGSRPEEYKKEEYR